MAKAIISIECLKPSDWDPILGDDSKLLQLLTSAGWELTNIDAESVRAFPDGEPAKGVILQTNEIPFISLSRMAAVSSTIPGIISTTISLAEPVVIQGKEKRLNDGRTGAARVRVSTPNLTSREGSFGNLQAEQDLDFSE